MPWPQTRAQLQLDGPVKSVTETEIIRGYDATGAVSRNVSSILEFNRAGQMVAREDGLAGPWTRWTYTWDAQGRLIEAQGVPLDKETGKPPPFSSPKRVTLSYTDRADGGLDATVVASRGNDESFRGSARFDAGLRLVHSEGAMSQLMPGLTRNEYEYDAAGRLIRTESESPTDTGGRMLLESKLVYDAQGRLTGKTSFQGGHQISEQRDYEYGSRGELLRWIAGTKEDGREFAYTYTFDNHGNWVTKTEVETDFGSWGRSEPRPSEWTREITYY